MSKPKAKSTKSEINVSKRPVREGETPENPLQSGSTAGTRKLSRSSRQSSPSPHKVTPRKVSEGLKQLPPNAYRFVRESYLLLDSESTGSVSRETLRDMLASLGMQDRGDKMLNQMMERAGEPMTFAGYLSVVGELLADLPSQEEMDVMLEAFQNKDGTFDEQGMREALKNEGLTDEEIDNIAKVFSKPSRLGPIFDVKTFASTMSI